MAKLTRPEAVTLALFSLGGAEHPAETEDIAVRVADLAPGMFSWQKEEYRDRIDKELVRVALSDARLKKNWVVGSHNKGGWVLTPAGQQLAEQNKNLLDELPIQRARGNDERASERERARILTSDAYAQFAAGGPDAVTPEAAAAMFRINVYLKGQARERKIARLLNQFGEDRELGKLVHLSAERVRERAHT